MLLMHVMMRGGGGGGGALDWFLLDAQLAFNCIIFINQVMKRRRLCVDDFTNNFYWEKSILYFLLNPFIFKFK